MNIESDLVLTFPGNPTVDAMLSIESAESGWVNSQTYRATYSLSNQNVDVENIDVFINGGQDPYGNDQSAYLSENHFSILLNTTGLNENNLNQVLTLTHVYPNPVQTGELFYIEVKKTDKPLTVQLFDIHGQLLSSETAFTSTAGKYGFHTTGIAAGIYFAQVSDGEKQAVFKVSIID